MILFIIIFTLDSPKKGNSRLFTISTDSHPRNKIVSMKQHKDTDSSTVWYMNMRKKKNIHLSNKTNSQDRCKIAQLNL